MYMKALQKKSYNKTEANASAQLLWTDRILLSALSIFQSFLRRYSLWVVQRKRTCKSGSCEIALSFQESESTPGNEMQPCVTNQGKIHYLGKVTHFQVEADDEDIPGDPEHKPDRILGREKKHKHDKHAIQ